MQYPQYPGPQQGLTWQRPRSWWFYICLLATIAGILIALAAGILGIIFGTAGIVAPATQGPVEGGNTGTAHFSASGNPNAPHSTRYDALVLTGSLSALTSPVSNVTGVGTAVAIEQGGIEVYNGGFYSRDRIVSDTGIGYPSDRRIKRNIEDIDTRQALETIKRLKPVSFDYMKHWAIHKDKDGNPLPPTPGMDDGGPGGKPVRQRGFIAQDVKPVVPNAVDTISRTLAPDESNPAVPRQLDDFHIMDMSAIIPDIVGALKENAKTIDILAHEVERLEQQNQELRSQMAAKAA